MERLNSLIKLLIELLLCCRILLHQVGIRTRSFHRLTFNSCVVSQVLVILQFVVEIHLLLFDSFELLFLFVGVVLSILLDPIRLERITLLIVDIRQVLLHHGTILIDLVKEAIAIFDFGVASNTHQETIKLTQDQVLVVLLPHTRIVGHLIED